MVQHRGKNDEKMKRGPDRSAHWENSLWHIISARSSLVNVPQFHPDVSGICISTRHDHFDQIRRTEMKIRVRNRSGMTFQGLDGVCSAGIEIHWKAPRLVPSRT